MTKLRVESRGQYRKPLTRKVVFRYAVSGSPKAIEAYRDAQGEYYREDDKTGEAMWFSPNFIGKSGTIVVTDDNKVYADTSELEQQASLVSQLGGNLGVAMAAEIAKQMVQQSPSSVAPKVEETKIEDRPLFEGF
jgi:hypothetical protein